jgi:hypothetical protein
MSAKIKNNFWLDVIIFILFLIVALTGLLLWLVLPDGQGNSQLVWGGLSRAGWIDLHNWFGVALLSGVSIHLLLHWTWIECVGRRLFKKLARQARVNFSLDTALFLAFFVINISGLIIWLILPSGGFQGGRNPAYGATLLMLTRHNWKDLHLWASLAMIAVMIFHVTLHWPWVMCVIRRYGRAAMCRRDECATAAQKS